MSSVNDSIKKRHKHTIYIDLSGISRYILCNLSCIWAVEMQLVFAYILSVYIYIENVTLMRASIRICICMYMICKCTYIYIPLGREVHRELLPQGC